MEYLVANRVMPRNNGVVAEKGKNKGHISINVTISFGKRFPWTLVNIDDIWEIT